MAHHLGDTIRPNMIAALPGRMVDEAPKRYGTDRGAREQKFTPMVFGLIGGVVVSILLVMTDVLNQLLLADGMMSYIGLFGLTFAIFIGMATGFGGYTYLNLRTRSYALDNDGVEVREGFLKQEARRLPYNRISNVTLCQNVWERLFDAGTLKLQTVGSGDAELWLRGIDTPEETADRIRERVRDTDVTRVETDA